MKFIEWVIILSKEVKDWNLRDMTDYMVEKHREVFGFEYSPFGSWTIERSMITKLFGNGRKDGIYDKELFPHFVDVFMESYVPNERFPSTNFGFTAKYKGHLIAKAKERLEESKQVDEPVEDLSDWFNS